MSAWGKSRLAIDVRAMPGKHHMRNHEKAAPEHFPVRLVHGWKSEQASAVLGQFSIFLAFALKRR
ncbi:MAG: hypothetical protein ACRYF5_15750 [Janthinobacterium lividum]